VSGPIVRKYGFPNFDKIFGQREVQHGADESTQAVEGDPKLGSGSDSLKPAPSSESRGATEGAKGQGAW
jgi:hypothetical protein